VQTIDGRPFSALADDLGLEGRRLFYQAFDVRAYLSAPGPGTPATETEHLAEGGHPFAQLLTLIEDRDELSDDLWAGLHESVGDTFGKSLAAAAARAKLSLPLEHAGAVAAC